MKSQKPKPRALILLFRTVIIAIALLFFFSMMAGMYYKSEPRAIKTAICDEDYSPLSRSLSFNIQASNLFAVKYHPVDYLALQKLIDDGKIDLGIVIPNNTYKDILNRRNVRILAALNGTANPIIPKLALGGLNRVIMTINNQYLMHVPVEDLGAIPNTRHAKAPLLMVSDRVFYSPAMNMEASMLPAFMGLAMQIVSMVIIMLGLRTSHRFIQNLFPKITKARQMPLKPTLIPIISSLIIVGTAISLAFYSTMYLFKVPFPHNIWNVVLIIFLFVFAMQSIALFISLNIDNSVVLIALVTVIVFPAFMYSGFLIPIEQMASIPKMIGSWFPLRYYLQAVYGVFNRHLPLSEVITPIKILLKFIGGFLTLSAISILIGTLERKKSQLSLKETDLNTEVSK